MIHRLFFYLTYTLWGYIIKMKFRKGKGLVDSCGLYYRDREEGNTDERYYAGQGDRSDDRKNNG